MPFITIPICYIEVEVSEEEEEESEIRRLQKKAKKAPPVKHADVSLNTRMICSYVGEDETNHTMINMADGTTWECVWDREEFENRLQLSDTIVDLTSITEN